MTDISANEKLGNMNRIKNIVIVFLLMMAAIKGHAQVNLQTGSATFSLPMFNWQDDKSRLNAMVALSYNSGNGLKVNDVASNVGQGWNLVAGGVVTRMQVGEPDDQKGRDVNDQYRYPNGYLYNPVNAAAKGCPNFLQNYPIFNDKDHLYKEHNNTAADRELDYFSFQFNGRSGLFVLGKSNGNIGYTLGDSKLKVTFELDEGMAASQGIRTTITAFNIQDENGLVYKFRLHGLTRVMKMAYCDGTLAIQHDQPHFSRTNTYHESTFVDNAMPNPYIINSWYLSEVEDALTHRKISLSYQNQDITNSAISSLTYYDGKDYSVMSHQNAVTQTPAISSLAMPDGHNVVFNYGAPRIDLKGSLSLGSVDIMYNGRYVSRFQLNTAYFIRNRIGTPTSDYQKRLARLCLRSVKRYGVDLRDEDRPYIFDYYTGSSAADDIVPPSYCLSKDIWGFYNGSNSVGSDGRSIPVDAYPTEIADPNPVVKGLCFIRDNVTNLALNAKDGYAKNGLLKQVVYPTGGTLGYAYGQNMAAIGGQPQPSLADGVHVSQTSTTDGTSDNTGSNGCGNPIVTNYDYTLDNGQPSMWGTEEMPLNNRTVHNHYEPESKKWGLMCSYRFKYPGILEREQAYDPTSLAQTIMAISEVMGIVSNVESIVHLITYITAGTGLGVVIIDLAGYLINFAITCFSKPATDSDMTLYNNYDLHSSNPLPVQFKRVTVSSPGNNGKTVTEFTSSDDYALWAGPGQNNAMSMKQRFAPWAYGLPKKVTVYDNNGYPIKQTENIYSFNRLCHSGHVGSGFYYNCSNLKTPLVDTSCKCMINKSNSQRNDWWDDDAANPWIDASYTTDLTSNANLAADKYDLYTGRTELDTSYERSFNPNSSTQFLQAFTAYTYNTINYQPSQVTSQMSNGDLAKKNITYSVDDPTGTAATMLQNNMVNEPVGVSALVAKANTPWNSQTLGTTTTQYTQLASGAIKPSGTVEQRFGQPDASSTTVQTQYFLYDANSNLTGMKDEGNHTVANIYGYNDKYIIASVINADPIADKPAYTSFEDGGYGGWTLSGNPTYNNIAITGNRSLELSSVGNLSSPLNTAKPYKLSFWASSPVSVSGGAALSKLAPVLGELTFYEYDIAQGTPSVSVSGSGQLDELRLYPSDARMRTVTYDPLIGKTSECDENNRVTYYEYDGLSRLRFVKDKDRNVVKMYEYSYKQQQNGCPGMYYNLAVTETYTRGNCGAGYQGGNTTYTIPANKYSSAISQADADQQAENELNNSGQPSANTNGSCWLIYYNTAISQAFTKECGVGYIGNTVSYTVPAGRYSSIVGQADADAKAATDMEANGQSYANNIAGSCSVDPNPEWEGDENAQTRCGDGTNGAPAGNIAVLMTDVNPNSSSYGQQQWRDGGADASCTAQPCNNCYAVYQKCINGYCETGYKVYTGSDCGLTSVVNGPIGQRCYCTYHYEWSDGSWSQDYHEYSDQECPLYQ